MKKLKIVRTQEGAIYFKWKTEKKTQSDRGLHESSFPTNYTIHDGEKSFAKNRQSVEVKPSKRTGSIDLNEQKSCVNLITFNCRSRVEAHEELKAFIKKLRFTTAGTS